VTRDRIEAQSHPGARIRPVTWVVLGMSGALLGLAVAGAGLASARRAGGVDDAARCTTEFAKGCTTERAAVLARQRYRQYQWLDGDTWVARVPDGAPGLTGAELLKLEVPWQDGREELAPGLEITVVFLGRWPAWIRLPSGTVLEIGYHPRRQAPLWAALGLFILGAGTWGVRIGAGARRRGGGWLRPTAMSLREGPDLVPTLAGALGFFACLFGGGAIWMGVAGALIGAALGVLGWRRARHRRAHR
jgi:hypothetical protein